MVGKDSHQAKLALTRLLEMVRDSAVIEIQVTVAIENPKQLTQMVTGLPKCACRSQQVRTIVTIVHFKVPILAIAN